MGQQKTVWNKKQEGGLQDYPAGHVAFCDLPAEDPRSVAEHREWNILSDCCLDFLLAQLNIPGLQGLLV